MWGYIYTEVNHNSIHTKRWYTKRDHFCCIFHVGVKNSLIKITTTICVVFGDQLLDYRACVCISMHGMVVQHARVITYLCTFILSAV